MAVIKSGDSTNELSINNSGAAKVIITDTSGNELNLLGSQNRASILNSSTTILNAGVTFTGTAEDIVLYNGIIVAVKTDQNGTLYIDFSNDGLNWDSTLTYPYYASQVNPPHKLTTSRAYCRIRFTNTSASNQTYFRLQTLFGDYGTLTSPLNSSIHPASDATLVRPLDFNLMVSEGLYQNRTNTIKDGFVTGLGNGAITTDVWNNGSTYTGFPSATAAAECVVAGADTGTVYYSYMATDTDTDYTFGSVAITGAGTYSLGHNIWRCNFAYFVKNSTTAFNAGDITIRHTATPANIFVTIPTGYSQSYCSAYTVPYNSSVYIDRWQGSVRGSTSGSIDGMFWYRGYNESPRYRFPFELQYGSLYFDDVDFLVKIPSRTDIIPRLLNTSVNALSAKFSYRIVKVKE